MTHYLQATFNPTKLPDSPLHFIKLRYIQTIV